MGWGETAILFSMYGLEKSFAQLVQDVFARYLDARDPMNREKLSKLMRMRVCAATRRLFHGRRHGAFDIAMWDICAKALDVPVCDLGRFRDRIRSWPISTILRQRPLLRRRLTGRARPNAWANWLCAWSTKALPA